MGGVILSVVFDCKSVQKELSERLVKERISFSKEHLEPTFPSCGSIFKTFNGRIMNALKGLTIGGARYSKKTTNWISNINKAKPADVRRLIKIAVLLHKITFRKYELEVEVW